jgi:hypothetical protein
VDYAKEDMLPPPNHYKKLWKLQLGTLLLAIVIYLTYFPMFYYLFNFSGYWFSLNSTQIFVRLIVIGFSAAKLREWLKYWFPIVELVLIFTQINIYHLYFLKPVHWNKYTNRKNKKKDQAAFTFLVIIGMKYMASC